MAWTRVNAAGSTAGTGTMSQTITPTTAGNLLVAFCVGHTSIAFSDNKSQTWTKMTDQSNISGSSKHYCWGYVINTVAAVTSVTLTTGTGTSWMEVVEYSPGSGNTVNFVASTETNFTVATGVSPIGGTLGGSAAAGDLVLIGTATNNEGATTIGAGTGITSVVGTAGSTNVSNSTVGVGENLSCSASPAANLTLTGTTSGAGATTLAFHAAASGATAKPKSLYITQATIRKAFF